MSSYVSATVDGALKKQSETFDGPGHPDLQPKAPTPPPPVGKNAAVGPEKEEEKELSMEELHDSFVLDEERFRWTIWYIQEYFNLYDMFLQVDTSGNGILGNPFNPFNPFNPTNPL